MRPQIPHGTPPNLGDTPKTPPNPSPTLWDPPEPCFFLPPEAVVSSGRVEKSPHEQEIKFFAKVRGMGHPKMGVGHQNGDETPQNGEGTGLKVGEDMGGRIFGVLTGFGRSFGVIWGFGGVFGHPCAFFWVSCGCYGFSVGYLGFLWGIWGLYGVFGFSVGYFGSLWALEPH